MLMSPEKYLHKISRANDNWREAGIARACHLVDMKSSQTCQKRPAKPERPRGDAMTPLAKMPPQIVRLVLLTIGIICVYFTARYFLVPQSFGQYGHYRGDAIQDIASKQPFWAGKASCVECHADHVAKLAKDAHKTLSCETCHGPAGDHVKNRGGEKLPKLNISMCIRCHEASPSRPKWLHQIDPHDHYTGNLCTDCHEPHQPTVPNERESHSPRRPEEFGWHCRRPAGHACRPHLQSRHPKRPGFGRRASWL